MAMAGFYAIHNSEIRFGCDGVWYADGEPIDNPRIARLFSQSVVRAPEGDGYMLRVGDETARIIVDDTPYVVTGVSAGDRLVVTLNDGSTEDVAPESLRLGDNNVFYCRVKAGRESARFLRPAHYQLAEHIGETAAGEFELRLGTRAFPIRSR